MIKNVIVLLLAFTLTASAAPKDAPDKAHAQKVCDAWATLDVNNSKQYYDNASTNAYFDLAPLKYANWKEYESGVVNLLKNFKSIKFTVNDDFTTHKAGKVVWSTATMKLDSTDVNDKSESTDVRWTAIWEKKGGKWLITHEHVSAPMH
jgi:ketosteroid isomerase-like protein